MIAYCFFVLATAAISLPACGATGVIVPFSLNGSYSIDNSVYYHLHIPKAGGLSFRMDVERMNEVKRFGHFYTSEDGFRVVPRILNGDKLGRNKANHEDQFRNVDNVLVMALFRNPVSLVGSIYMQCTTASVHSHKERMPHTFDEWISKWDSYAWNRTYGYGKPESFYCSDPRNFQTSKMAGHGLNEIWFVGIVEHYTASMCLLNYQIYKTIPAACDCALHTEQEAVAALKLTHDDHGTKKIDWRNVSEETVELVHKFTKLDENLYHSAKELFMSRIKEVEKKSGMTLLCGLDASGTQSTSSKKF